MQPRSFTFVSEGKVPVSVSMAVRDLVAASRGERIKLTLAQARKHASTPQREYYFAVIVDAWQYLLREATGRHWDKDDTHDFLMTEIGQWFKEPETVMGKKVRRRRSYMDLSVKEAEEHHTKCRMAAAAEGVDIPEPNEDAQVTG
jgi:hypothetical protein